MKKTQRIVGPAVICLGLVMATGCVVDQNGHVVGFVTPVVIGPAPVENDQVHKLRQIAEQGDSIAQFTLGSFYASGRGVPRDYVQAARWYRLSAEQGYAPAQNRLGVCYFRGLGVQQNQAEAVVWYSKAAAQGNAFAEDNLGVSYSSGRGVMQNYDEAVKWYRLAADQGTPAAQNHLGNCYYNGHGVAQDYKEALDWYRKAAAQGNVAAKRNLLVCESRVEAQIPPPNGQTIQNSATADPNSQTAQNPPAEQNDTTTEDAITVDQIKVLSRAGVKADTLTDQIKQTNSKFSAQDIAAAQQANVDPSVIECMKDNLR